MNCTVVIDWKFVVALGIAVTGTVLAIRMESGAVERVSIHAIDSFKEMAVASNSNC